jgi:hypothetical protein
VLNQAGALDFMTQRTDRARGLLVVELEAGKLRTGGPRRLAVLIRIADRLRDALQGRARRGQLRGKRGGKGSGVLDDGVGARNRGGLFLRGQQGHSNTVAHKLGRMMPGCEHFKT